MEKDTQIEKLLWSIAFPGFGQLLNGKFLKGIAFIILEVIINVQANLNEVIVYSFHGSMQLAIDQTDYQWLMFYPCVYMFAIWDAFRDAGGGKSKYGFLPFVFSAFLGNIGLIYSNLEIFGILFGPVFLPIIFFGLGACIGLFIRFILINLERNKTSKDSLK